MRLHENTFLTLHSGSCSRAPNKLLFSQICTWTHTHKKGCEILMSPKGLGRGFRQWSEEEHGKAGDEQGMASPGESRPGNPWLVALINTVWWRYPGAGGGAGLCRLAWMSCRCMRVGAGEERRSAPPEGRRGKPAGWENIWVEVLRNCIGNTEICAAIKGGMLNSDVDNVGFHKQQQGGRTYSRRFIVSPTSHHLSLPADYEDNAQHTFTRTIKPISCSFRVALLAASFPPTCEQSASRGAASHQQLQG